MTTPSPEMRDLEAARSAPVRRLVIIGFMGAGKSTVGSLLARALGWDFIDLDDEIARREGMPVPAIIQRSGVSGFRSVESAVGREVLRQRRVVISVGGGWPAERGHMDMLGHRTVSVWLRVGTETALQRIAGSDTARPLLQVRDPRATAESLLRARTPHYRRGDLVVDTEDSTPDEVVRKILEHFSPSTAGSTAGGAERNTDEIK